MERRMSADKDPGRGRALLMRCRSGLTTVHQRFGKHLFVALQGRRILRR
jgi:hypothetical protein